MELLRKYDSYLGYLDGKDKKWIGRTNKFFAKYIRHDGEVMEIRDFILNVCVDGYYPEIEEYNGKIHYYLKNKDNSTMYEVKKTEYDFAEYIVKNGFTNLTVIGDYLETEKTKRQIEAKAEADKVLAEVERRNQIGKNLEICQNAAMELVAKYDNEARLNLAYKIFSDMYGFDVREDSNFNHINIRKLLVSIENIDNQFCRNHLKEVLHADNKASRKVFEHLTGLKLPKGTKDTKTFIDGLTVADYGEEKEYKTRKKPQRKDQEVYYIAIPDGGKVKYRATYGEPLKKYSLNLFIHKMPGSVYYTISSAECGFKFCEGESKQKALDKLKAIIDDRGIEKTKEMINGFCEKYGYSPWVKEQENKMNGVG